MINGINSYSQNYQAPAMQGELPIDKDKIKQNAGNTAVAKRFDDAENNPLTLAFIPPFWLAIGKMMDKFNKKCRGEYKDTIPGKISAWADKQAERPIFQSKNAQKISSGLKSVKTFVNDKIIQKSAILRALTGTPSQPTNKMVLTQLKGVITQYTNDYTTVVDKYLEDNVTKSRIDAVAKRTGKTVEEIRGKFNDKYLKKIGLDDAKYKLIKDNAADHIDEIIKASEGNKVQVKLGKKGFGGIFGRTVEMSEFANKLKATKGAAGSYAKTTFGKILPKWTMAVTEGLTNGTAGGKLAMLMQAYIFADAAVHALKAEKGDKGKTLAERVIYDLGFFLTMPLGLKLMHGVGGLQYTGMDAKQVAKYRKTLAAVNKCADEGKYTKTQYKHAKEVLKRMKKGNSKGIFQKLARTVGNVLTVGLETVNPYIPKNASAFTKNVRKAGYWLKQGAGYPMRIGVFFLAISPFLGKCCAKLSHAIFGKPKHSVLDDGKESEETKQATQGNTKPQSTNLLDLYKQQREMEAMQAMRLGQPIPSSQDVVQTPQTPQAPASNPVSNPITQPQTSTKPQEKRTYTYIPSTEAVKTSADPNADKYNSAIKRADMAEKRAMEIMGRI